MKKVISYIGSKEKLLTFIKDEVDSYIKNDNVSGKRHFIDGFTGTTVVSKYISLMHPDWDITMFDISKYSSVLSSLVSANEIDKTELIQRLDILDKLDPVAGLFFNEFSINGNVSTIDKERFDIVFGNQSYHSRMFFTENVGKKIDAIRNKIIEWLSSGKIDRNMFNSLMLFLVRYVDKNANTTSVYGAYLKKIKNSSLSNNHEFVSKQLINAFCENGLITTKSIGKKTFETGNTIELLESLDYSDKNIIYLDPPYNTRRYESNYHILNYVVDENFNVKHIKHNSKTGLPANSAKNPFSSKVTFKNAFESMICTSLKKAPVVFVSFNNEGEFTQDDINYLKERLSLNIQKRTKCYKRFTSGEGSGKNNNKSNTVDEILWVITKSDHAGEINAYSYNEEYLCKKLNLLEERLADLVKEFDGCNIFDHVEEFNNIDSQINEVRKEVSLNNISYKSNIDWNNVFSDEKILPDINIEKDEVTRRKISIPNLET